jgi:hypothetical protein
MFSGRTIRVPQFLEQCPPLHLPSLPSPTRRRSEQPRTPQLGLGCPCVTSQAPKARTCCTQTYKSRRRWGPQVPLRNVVGFSCSARVSQIDFALATLPGKFLINAQTGQVKCYFIAPVTRVMRTWKLPSEPLGHGPHQCRTYETATSFHDVRRARTPAASLTAPVQLLQ